MVACCAGWSCDPSEGHEASTDSFTFPNLNGSGEEILCGYEDAIKCHGLLVYASAGLQAVRKPYLTVVSCAQRPSSPGRTLGALVPSQHYPFHSPAACPLAIEGSYRCRATGTEQTVPQWQSTSCLQFLTAEGCGLG